MLKQRHQDRMETTLATHREKQFNNMVRTICLLCLSMLGPWNLEFCVAVDDISSFEKVKPMEYKKSVFECKTRTGGLEISIPTPNPSFDVILLYWGKIVQVSSLEERYGGKKARGPRRKRTNKGVEESKETQDMPDIDDDEFQRIQQKMLKGRSNR